MKNDEEGTGWGQYFVPFSALTLLVGYQEGPVECHLPPKVLFWKKWKKKTEGVIG